jgi:hypothetical protein
VVYVIAADVKPHVTGEGKDALHLVAVEFGRVFGGV